MWNQSFESMKSYSALQVNEPHLDNQSPPTIETYWDKILPFLENIHEIKLVEGHIFHYYEGYSGRVDFVASFYNIPCVIEFIVVFMFFRVQRFGLKGRRLILSRREGRSNASHEVKTAINLLIKSNLLLTNRYNWQLILGQLIVNMASNSTTL
ncbi:hypothetical protein [Dapis sp. BLCC M172]|uniref:hypothetical protein n=1 Tax=Dapis sp. BLCC M172 TaxID=2975281 RepID=UPI003CE699B0